MLYRLILPEWMQKASDYDKKATPPVIEGDLTEEQMLDYNGEGYNCYFLPNYPKHYDQESVVDGSMIDTFTSVFVDLDMKDYLSDNKSRRHEYPTKEAFIEVLQSFELPPHAIVDSGGGIHAYWYVNDLDAMGYLRLQRRLGRYFKADPAIAKLYQLMRVPGTINWKIPDDLKKAEWVSFTDGEISSEQLDKVLPRLSPDDEAYCKNHYDRTHGLDVKVELSEELPPIWFKFAKKGTEMHRLFYGQVKDRSNADYRLGILMHGAGFSKQEALEVLSKTNKASDRVGIHRYNYADNIVSKIFIAKERPELAATMLTKSVRDMLSANPDDETLKGTRFECDPIFDATEHGFRLGQVFGLIGGAGAGKTMFGFNVFKGFALRNNQYIHLAVSLEQPELEYAQRWRKMNLETPHLLDSVHILGNYNDDGTYRHLSLAEIEAYVHELEKSTGKKVGAVMIDHIGVLKQETEEGDRQGLIDICQVMKAFAVNTNTFLIMQSQTSREKAGEGDIELDKDAAYGTSNFEWFADYVMTLWQPLKRVYDRQACPFVTVFKFCKIRHKNVKKDRVKEGQRYPLIMDPETDLLRELVPAEYQSYEFHSKQATILRNRDKKREPGAISAIDWTKKPKKVADDGNQHKPNGNNGRVTDASRGLGHTRSGTRLPKRP